jgi:hypothetical protein
VLLHAIVIHALLRLLSILIEPYGATIMANPSLVKLPVCDLSVCLPSPDLQTHSSRAFPPAWSSSVT